jgi:hypothetical protein
MLARRPEIGGKLSNPRAPPIQGNALSPFDDADAGKGVTLK